MGLNFEIVDATDSGNIYEIPLERYKKGDINGKRAAKKKGVKYIDMMSEIQQVLGKYGDRVEPNAKGDKIRVHIPKELNMRFMQDFTHVVDAGRAWGDFVSNKNPKLSAGLQERFKRDNANPVSRMFTSMFGDDAPFGSLEDGYGKGEGRMSLFPDERKAAPEQAAPAPAESGPPYSIESQKNLAMDALKKYES